MILPESGPPSRCLPRAKACASGPCRTGLVPHLPGLTLDPQMVVPKPCTGEGVFPPLVSWGVILFHQGFEKKESFLNLLLNLSGPDSDGSPYCLSVLPFLPQC